MEYIRNEEIQVLIVDDNKNNLEIIAHVLRKAGFQVMMASDGPLAIELTKETPPDIILLDIMMPGMDGFEVCKILRKMDKTSTVPIIFLSAKDEDSNIETGFEVGGTDYITKPFHERILIARVRIHIENGFYLRNLQHSNDILREKTELLIEVKKNLEKKNRQLDLQIQQNLHLLATVNDEIRNPLTVALSLLDMDKHAKSEMIVQELYKIDNVINNLERGVLESDKIREYLKKYLECNELT
ncbi:MAG: response regulator [Methanomicrobiales archaeon]|nr:response regulator [Methanomicrobiales archaeon]